MPMKQGTCEANQPTTQSILTCAKENYSNEKSTH
uniref:Uncharacterized protein n=1 Tax=Parascaris equorum TaxID=6256 RepID=A0A914RX16_PAREQ